MDLYDIRNQLNLGKSIYDLPLRVTFYARVSTGTDEQAHSLKNQITYYSDFISQNPNWTYIEGYIDEGLSGTSATKRESFLRMIDDAKLGKFDFIVTKEISRFSRNTLDSIKYTQDLLSCGVGVLFQSDNINTLMPDSELRLTIMSSIAQDEVRKISERVRFGFKRAIEKGVVLGNSKMWGYTKKDGKLVIDEEEAEVVRQIFHMYATQNMGLRTISAKLGELGVRSSNGNELSFSTLKNIITNPKYMGYYCGNKTHKYDYKRDDRKVLDKSEWVMYRDEETVPPIVSEELWQKANDILVARGKKQSADDKTTYQNKYPYSGKIICTDHNVPYYRALYQYKSGAKEVWQCKHYASKGRAGCISPTIYSSEVDAVMKHAYDILVTERANIIHDLVKIYSTISSKSTIKDDIAKSRVAINEIIKKKDKLLDLSIKGRLSDSEFEERNNVFNNEIEKMKIRIEDLEEQERKNRDISVTVETLRQMIADKLDFSDGFNSNSIVDSILDRIEVYKTDDKKVIELKIYFKVINEELRYKVTRGKSTSVCYTPYI